MRSSFMKSRLTRAGAAVALAFGGLGVAAATATVTAAPASAATCYTFPRVLSSGASGSDVAQLQIRVAGWVPSGQQMSVDGSFGPQTKSAVINFQRGYGLVQDGIAGPATAAKIYSIQSSDCTPAHFTYSEASANCGRGFNGSAAQKENIKRVLWRAEALRHQLGDHPLNVTSGYRDSRCNSSVGGTSNSQHLTGAALDLVPGDGYTSICSIAKQARYAGVNTILGPGFPGHSDHTHIDMNSTRYWNASACSGW